MSKTEISPDGESWDTYWHGTGDVGAFSSGGVSHPAVSAFWNNFFVLAKQQYAAPRMLDIATGNGAVVEVALQQLGIPESAVTCVDVSSAAIKNVKRRFPSVNGVVADAASIPLEDAGFDLATSQFGLEYAGDGAIAEAARLVAPGGRLVLVLHTESGSIYQECADSLAAIKTLQESHFVPHAIALFKAGFAAVRGADRAPYDTAGKAFAPSIKSAESIMKKYGEHVAGNTVASLYSDIGRIHSNIQKYDPEEVLGWLSTMDGELDAYAGRMASMMDAAATKASFDVICTDLLAAGFTLEQAEPMQTHEQELPLAWILVAVRLQDGNE